MATCNIRLYGDRKNTLTSEVVPFELQLGKNWVVDDLISYLSNKTLTTINNCQYIKDLGNLTMTLKLDLPQAIIEMGIDGYKYIRYIGLQNRGTSEWFYYFVTDYERLSENCINFILVMDTLNSTLSNVSYKRKLEFTDKTNITREHVDRFYQSHTGITYIRNIPMLPEGINPPLYKTKSIKLDTLQQGDYSKNNWYLIYRTEIEPGETDLTKSGNPIKCYLLNDLPIQVTSGATTEFNLTMTEFKKYTQYGNTLGIARDEDKNTGIITIADKRIDMKNYDYCYITTSGTIRDTQDKGWVIVVGNAPTSQTVIYSSTSDDTNVVISFTGDWTKGHWISTYNAGGIELEPKSTTSALALIKSSDNTLDIVIGGLTIAFKDLDRTDSRLVKIICLPYCPIKYTLSNNVFSFLYPWVKPTDWDIVDRMIEIKDITKILKVDLSKVVSDDTATYKELTQKISVNDTDYEQPRFMQESKLYHSEFFQRKYYYDTFSYTINLEKMVVNVDEWKDADLSKTYLTYQMTNGIKSSMLFTIPTPNETEYYQSDDYDMLFYVNRNNEVSMYDNAYLDYIRNGYNYDVKSKNRNIALSVLGMFTGGASSLIGLGQTLAFKEKPEALNYFQKYGDIRDSTGLPSMAYDKYKIATRKFGTSIGLSSAGVALSVIGNVASGISSIVSQEEQLKQNLQQRAMQATTVENADDLDLLKAYSGNKVSVATWKPTPEMQKYLSDLFYYTGSKVGYMGVPNTHKRLYFDFLQCNPIFKATYTWDNAIIADVTNKLQEGVTYFHNPYGVYDFEQKFENWEVWFFPDTSTQTLKLEQGDEVV